MRFENLNEALEFVNEIAKLDEKYGYWKYLEMAKKNIVVEAINDAILSPYRGENLCDLLDCYFTNNDLETIDIILRHIGYHDCTPMSNIGKFLEDYILNLFTKYDTIEYIKESLEMAINNYSKPFKDLLKDKLYGYIYTFHDLIGCL